MENNGQISKNRQPAEQLILSDKGKNIAKVIVDVNNLVAFKLTAYDVMDWARQIDRIAPEIDLKALRFIMDAFATEALVYDKDKGIQNIFNGLKRVKKTDDGYKINKLSWL